MVNIDVELYNDYAIKIKDSEKGILLNQWNIWEWRNDPCLIPIISDHIVTCFENPYKIAYKEGNLEPFNNDKVTLKNTAINSDDYAFHTQVKPDRIDIFDLTGDDQMEITRKQRIKSWTEQQWVTAPFIGRIVFKSIILSYKKPEKYVQRVINGKENNYRTKH